MSFAIRRILLYVTGEYNSCSVNPKVEARLGKRLEALKGLEKQVGDRVDRLERVEKKLEERIEER
jgi:hypothetical protein